MVVRPVKEEAPSVPIADGDDDKIGDEIDHSSTISEHANR